MKSKQSKISNLVKQHKALAKKADAAAFDISIGKRNLGCIMDDKDFPNGKFFIEIYKKGLVVDRAMYNAYMHEIRRIKHQIKKYQKQISLSK